MATAQSYSAGPIARGDFASEGAVWTRQSDMVRAGVFGGIAGGVVIWIYEAVVWVGIQQMMPLGGIPRNATGLVFGKAVQDGLGLGAYFLGTGVGRFGSIVGSWVGGIMLGLGWGFSAILTLLAVPAVCAAIAIATAQKGLPAGAPQGVLAH